MTKARAVEARAVECRSSITDHAQYQTRHQPPTCAYRRHTAPLMRHWCELLQVSAAASYCSTVFNIRLRSSAVSYTTSAVWPCVRIRFACVSESDLISLGMGGVMSLPCLRGFRSVRMAGWSAQRTMLHKRRPPTALRQLARARRYGAWKKTQATRNAVGIVRGVKAVRLSASPPPPIPPAHRHSPAGERSLIATRCSLS